MTTWRHAESDFDRPRSGASYGSCRCGCQRSFITPDPASPCGTCGAQTDAAPWSHKVEPYAEGTHHFIPTLCLSCGHPIEEATR